MYDSILVPVDGGAASAGALDHAATLAAEQDAALDVLTVVEYAQTTAAAGTGATVPGRATEPVEAHGETVVGRAADRVPGSVPVETTVRRGAPSETIEEHASERDVDLVVMGTHARTGIERMVFGSTTEQLLRRSDRPVLAVTPGER